MLVVLLAAFENSPAARACSLMATVVSDDCVATEAALAWSWACGGGQSRLGTA